MMSHALPPPIEPNDCVRRALVVFADDSTLRLLKVLRRGFRHCFVVVHTADGWIVLNPMSHRTDLCFVAGPDARALAHWYRRLGLRVVPTWLGEPRQRPAPIRPYTCVESVKRVLGVHDGWMVTPWQLYRYLTSTKRRRELRQKRVDNGLKIGI